MTKLEFIWLIKEIHGKKLPNLDKIQNMGLLAVKIAQHYALRIDFLDEKVCTHLAKLYQNSKIQNNNVNNDLMEYTHSNDFIENYTYFNSSPIASASIGQVYDGILKGDKKVILKVIKNNFKEDFLKDIKNLESFLKLVLFFYPKLKNVFNPLEILNYIKEYTLEELNLLNEIKGQNLLISIYKDNFSTYDLSSLTFHKIYETMSSERVLVSEKIQGNTFQTLIENNCLSYETLLQFFHIHGFYIFKIGIFHGDIHPGNIFFTNDEKIVFIDTAAISTVSDHLKNGLYNFFKGLSYYDYKKCAHFLHEMSSIKLNESAFYEFEKKFLNLYSDFTNATVSDVSLTKRMMETIKLGVLSGMRFEEGMFGIIKSLMYLDGMVLKVNPNAILVKDLRSFIEEFDRV